MLRSFRWMSAILSLFFFLTTWAGPVERHGTSSVVLRVGGAVKTPLSLTAEDMAKLPRATVRAKDRDDREATFEGTPLVEILRAAGVEFGERLRGEALARCVAVEAADGYRAVFALPELDPAFAERTIILADRRDGKPLSEAEGRFRVIVPGEKRHARWVRQVVALTVHPV
jgi:DMSO/TMAO reductase YedYZ molybdopterin-dependent catalytic subunit